MRKLGVAAVTMAMAGLVVAPAASGASAETSASATKLIKKLKKQVKALEGRLAAVEARPTGGAPSGAAGGELAGTYPNPTIGTVNGLQLASSDSANPAIVFGPGGAEIYNVFGTGSVGIEAPAGLSVFGTANLTDDVTLNNSASGTPLSFANQISFPGSPANLYLSAANTLHTDDSLDVDGSATVDGQVAVNGFLKLQTVGAAPAATDCDAFGEQGRVVFENSLDRLYVCDALNGWKFVTVGT